MVSNDVDMKSFPDQNGDPGGDKEKMVTNGVGSDSSTEADAEVVSLADQKNQVDEMTKKPLALGDKWYLVSCTWMKNFKKFCDTNDDASSIFNPGPVNNSDILFHGKSSHQLLLVLFLLKVLLLSDGRTVKTSLLENVDFDLVPEHGWRLLVRWYGLHSFKDSSTEEDMNEEEKRVSALNNALEADPGASLGEIRRLVIEEGCYIKFLKIEIYYLELNTYKYPDNKFSLRLKMSKSNTIG